MFAFSRHDFFFVDIHITNIYVTNRLRSAWLPVDNQVIYDFHQRNIDKYTIHETSNRINGRNLKANKEFRIKFNNNKTLQMKPLT